MKKFISIFVVAFSMLFATTLESKAQSAILVQGGYSWSEGVVAAGVQFGELSTTLGYMPTKMPGDGSSVSGVVWNIKWGPEYDESGYYLSYAFNSVGYRSQVSYNGGSYQDNYVEGMNIVSLGYKVSGYNWYFGADVGYGWSESGSGTSWGVTLGFPIILY